MSQPKVEILPLKPAVRSDAPVTLDVLLKISAPAATLQTTRPALNLGLVLDRSGSMGSARKIDYAREAAAFAVKQLLPTDRVSVTIFDDRIETIVPNGSAENKPHILDAIQRIVPRGGTALHDGWKEGARQVSTNLLKGGLNRVILLSDGLANQGETNPDLIATDVNRSARSAVGTTTMGLGEDYNEDLLEAMARSGDGSYFYIENSSQLPAIFESELKCLMQTFGTAVELGLQPLEGNTVADVLNDLDKTPDDAIKLSNLVDGMPILVVVRLNVNARRGESEVARFTLNWTEPNSTDPRSLTVGLTLPSVAGPDWAALAANVEVEARAALLLAARYKKNATHCMDRRNVAEAKAWLAKARQVLNAAPQSPEVLSEFNSLDQIERMLDAGDSMRFQKEAKFQAHARRSSRPYQV